MSRGRMTLVLARLVLDLTGFPIALGTVTALQFVPILVFALVSGSCSSSTGLIPIGALLTGFVSDAFGIRVALLVNGGAVLAGAGLGLLYRRRNGVDARARPTANAAAAEPSPVLSE